MRILIAAIALTFSIASASSAAGELSRLHVDLDGDGKTEMIEVATSPARDAWRSRVNVTIGAANYSTEFHSADGDLPELRVVSIDRKRAQRQLILETLEAASCAYHVLSYAGQKLVPLLKFDGGPDCKTPRALGNGQVSVVTWQGFWEKEDRYRLNRDGTALVKERQAFYDVVATGAAAKAFALQGAECPKKMARPGAFIRVTRYDAKADRYKVQDTNGGCGWIRAADLNSADGLIKELPWAG